MRLDALLLLLGFVPTLAFAEPCAEPFVAVYAKVSPAVVSIHATKINKAKPQRRFETIVGSGVVIERDGQVLTKDRKSTRLNSSHVAISYAVFCLKKKNKLK